MIIDESPGGRGLSTFPQSSTGDESDGAMRSRGLDPQKATACRASASTGAKIPLFEWGARPERCKHVPMRG